MSIPPPHHPIFGSFVPGASPFRIKGTAYIRLTEHLERDLKGGTERVKAAIEDPRVVAFFEQSFLPSSLYDLLPLLEVGQIAARIADRPYRAFVRDGAALQATRDSSGVYSFLLRLASPQMAIERIPRIFKQYIDFGKFTGEATSKTRFEGSVSGIPKPVCPWIQSVIEGFTPVVLERAGAKSPVVVFHRFEQEKTLLEMPIMTARVSIRWD